MKQGTGNSTRAGTAVTRPVTHVVSVAATSQIGQSLGNHVTDNGQRLPGASRPLYPDKRGFEPPPPVSCTPHKAGSQGRS